MSAQPTNASTVLTSNLASEFPPGLKDFNYAPLWEFQLLGVDFAITKLTLLTWIAVVGLSTFFLLAMRRPTLVPGRLQWAGESIYGFIRDGVAKEIIGHEGIKFAPYLTTLFVFILANNIYGIVPLAQISPNAKISLPIVLAVLSYVLFIWFGIRKHGLRYFKNALFIPGIPWPVHFLVVPIELISTFLVRPVTLAVRLFANMFAGHLLLLVFTLGGVALLSADNFAVQSFSVLSFALGVAITFLEFGVAMVQAYVFTLLTASYLQGALADEH